MSVSSPQSPDAPSASSSSAAPPLPPPPSVKSQRVLACVLCQQRKVKCDRKFPCSGCARHGVQCVPATQTRRRRRRFPERDLLDRLRYYEDLLRQHRVKFEPLHGPSPSLAPDDEKNSRQGSYESGDEQTEAVVAAGSSPPQEASYHPKDLWQAMGSGFRDPDLNSDVDQLTLGISELMIKRAMHQVYDNDDHILFGSRSSHNAVDLSTLHPEPIQIFRLWQVYLDNVDPLLKVTHTPTLQGRIVEAASKLGNIGPDLEALMFSIYSMAILTLDKDECKTMFGMSKKDLSTKYQFACQQALSNAGFLRCNDRDCLTALFLYLVSVRNETMPSSLSSLLAVTIRIAERMGLHSEADLAKYGVLEAEMRRRLWWALVIFDHRTREKTHMTSSSLVPTWDCKVPLNVNDCDLRPEMKEPPPEEAQGKPTEALFAVVRAEMADFVRNTPSHLEFTMPILKPIARPLPEGGDLLALHRIIEEKHLKHCDEDNPLQLISNWTVRSYIAKHRLLAYYARFSKAPTGTSSTATSVAGGGSNRSTPAPPPQQPPVPTEAQRAAALSYSLAMLECDEKVMGSPLTKGYRWLLEDQFPFPAYVYVVQEVKRRPLSRHAARAWRAMSDSFLARFRPIEVRYIPIFRIFGNFILRSWDGFQAARRRARELEKDKEQFSRNGKVETEEDEEDVMDGGRGRGGVDDVDDGSDVEPPFMVTIIRQRLAEFGQEADKSHAAAAAAVDTPDLSTGHSIGGSSHGSGAPMDTDLDFSDLIMSMPMGGFGHNQNLAYSFDKVMQDGGGTYEEASPDSLMYHGGGGGGHGAMPNGQMASVPVDLDVNQMYWNSLEWGMGRGW